MSLIIELKKKQLKSFLGNNCLEISLEEQARGGTNLVEMHISLVTGEAKPQYYKVRCGRST